MNWGDDSELRGDVAGSLGGETVSGGPGEGVGVVATGQRTGNGGRGGRRDPVPALADDLILERLDGPPPALPPVNESPHDKARRMLIAAPGQWMVLNARVKLSEASARRLARSYQRAKPTRLIEQATGRFEARPFLRDQVWLVAAVYTPATVEQQTQPSQH